MKGLKLFILYISLKWLMFYIYQFLTGNTKWNFEDANIEGIFLALFMLTIIPLIETFVLFFPFQWALKTHGWIMISILIGTFSLELLIGWFATNQYFATWMLIKIVLSVFLFLLIYRKQIKFRAIA